MTIAFRILPLAGALTVGLAIAPAHAHDPHGWDHPSMSWCAVPCVAPGDAMIGPHRPGYGYGGHHMGPGMMGHHMGYGHGPHMWGRGAGEEPQPGPGMGMGPGMGPGMGRGMMRGDGAAGEDLDIEGARRLLQRHLDWHGNPNLKVGNVTVQDDDTILAEIVTKDDSLVRRLFVDRQTGWMRPDD